MSTSPCQHLVDALPQAMVLVDHTGKIELTNASAERLFEATRGDLVGQSVASLLHEGRGRELVHEALRDPARSRTLGTDGDLLGVTKLGHGVPLELSLNPIAPEPGAAFLLLIVDLRDRQRQQALLSSYRSMVELAPTSMLLVNPKGRIELVNAQVERLFGYRREDLLGHPVELLLPGEPAGEVAASIAPHRGEVTIKIEVQRQLGLTKELRRLSLEVRRSPIETSQGTFLIVELVDLHERRAEERFRQVVEAAPNAMLIVDRCQAITLVNRKTEALFGYARDELIGQSVELLIPDRFRDRHPRLVEEFFAAPAAAPAARSMGAGRELFGQRKDGSEFPIEIGLSQIDTPDGLATLASIIDITERRHHEDELRRSNAELEQFAYVASHDLQEPLRMVASYTQMLGQRYRGQLDEKADKYIDYAVDGAKRMQRLIADLLAYSRVGSQGAPLAAVATSVVLARVLSLFDASMAQLHATIEVEPLPTVLADEEQLHQLFQNLIGNALKFRSEQPPHLRIRATRQADRWQFAVQDNGIGIDMKYAERIFQMFQRLHERGKHEGSGIGLAIAKRIVERHGGHIWMESVLGVGTTFLFSLRACDSRGTS